MSTTASAGRHPFQTAVEATDLDAVAATLRDDVVFHTPIRFEPFRGRDQALGAMTVAGQAFAFQPEFRYTRTFQAGPTLALFFEAELHGKFLEGVDLIRLDDHDKVAELRVMIRPFNAARELVDFTRSLFEPTHHPQ